MTTTRDLFALHSASPTEYARAYAKLLSDLLSRVDYTAVGRVAEVFNNARLAGRVIFFMGNGGSAATASHFANDFGHTTFTDGPPPFRAISLTDNLAFFTAIGNDSGYDKVFLNQLRTLMVPGDVVVGISASGNSPNILTALDYANAHGGVTVGLLGFDGGKARHICQHVVLIPTAKGEYGPVEDVHLILDHILSTYFTYWLRQSQL